MKRLIFCLPLIIHAYLSLAQYQPGDAASAGMGGGFSHARESEALCGNISGLVSSRYTTIAVFSDIPFGLMAGARHRFGIIHPLKTGVGALAATRYGNHNLSVNSISALFAHQIALVALGFRASMHSYHIRGSDSAQKPSFDFGGRSQLSRDLSFGAYISNFTLTRLAGEASLQIPVVMTAGLRWQAATTTSLGIELVKEPGFKSSIRTGLEYMFAELLSLRGGFSSAPNRIHLGFGVKTSKLQISYASVTHPVLAMSHYLSIGYRI